MAESSSWSFATVTAPLYNCVYCICTHHMHTGFHAIDMETGAVQDLYLPSPARGNIHPHAIIALPRSGGSELLLCYDSE